MNFECLVKGDEMQVLELDSDGNWKPIFSGRERKKSAGQIYVSETIKDSQKSDG